MYKFILKYFLIFIIIHSPNIVFADYMRVTLLGTGSPRPDINRSGPAVLVEAGGKYLLFDAGRGVVQRIKQIDVPISEINQIFLTHLHSDHISALDDVWLTGWIYQRPKAMQVYGPAGTVSFIQGLQDAYSYDASIRHKHAGLRESAAELVAEDIKPGVIYAQNGIKVTAFLVDHKPVEPAYGYRIDFGDRSVVISGDTTYSESLVKHSQNVDVLIHEIFAAKSNILERNPRLQKIEHYHTNPEQLTRVLDEVNPRTAILTHVILIGVEENALMSIIKEDYSGEVHLGEDLMVIDVGSNIKVKSFANN